jgi:hypothetical protein
MNGGFLAVDAPFASGLSISAINDSRIVVGTYSSGSTIASFSGPLGHLQPFSYPQVSPLDLEYYPVSITTYATGLNNSQEITGAVASNNGLPAVPYVANAGLFERPLLGVGFDGAQSSQLYGINDSGVAAGTLTLGTGTYGLLLEPGSALGLPFQQPMMIAPP